MSGEVTFKPVTGLGDIMLDLSGLEVPLMSVREALGSGTGRISFDGLVDRIHENMARNLPSAKDLIIEHRTNKTLIIIGDGPSGVDVEQIKAVRKMQLRGAKVMTCNKAHDNYRKRGIVSDYCILADPKPWVADYIQRPHERTRYLVASQCDPLVFERLKDLKASVYIWHCGADYSDLVFRADAMIDPSWFQRNYPNSDWMCVPGKSTTVGLRAVPAGYLLGFRKFHLVGLDSSMRGTVAHASGKVQGKDVKEPEWITVTGPSGFKQDFLATDHMARQNENFDEMVKEMGDYIRNGTMEPIGIWVHGDGLLPAHAACAGWHVDPEMNLKWLGQR